MFDVMKDCVGMTLKDSAPYIGCARMQGVALFILEDKNDTTGKCIDEDFTLKMILTKHPELENYKIKYMNNFYSMLVVRAIKE